MGVNMKVEVDYPTRREMVRALVDLRKQGVEVDIVGNGRTLRVPQDYLDGAPQAASEASQTPAAPVALATPPAGGSEGSETPQNDGDNEPPADGAGAPATEQGEGDGTQATPVPSEGDSSVPADPSPEDDLIGDVPPAVDPQVAEFVNTSTFAIIKEALDAGLFTVEQVVLAEQAGQQRKGVLALGNKE